MSHVSPTTLDVSRAVAELDEHATGHPEKIIYEMRERVARNIDYQFERTGMALDAGFVTTQIEAILISHGASNFTIQEHCYAIGVLALVIAKARR